MSIIIPELYAAEIEGLLTCGEIKTKNKALLKWAKEHDKQWYVYHQKTTSGLIVTRVSLDVHHTKNSDRIHFHIDIVTKEWFISGVPSPSKHVPDIDDLLAPFVDQDVVVDVMINFPIDLANAPPIVTITQEFYVKDGDVSMKMTGGTLTVEGSPVSKVQWQSSKDNKRVFVSISGSTTLKFSTSYFDECLQLVSSYASTFLQKAEIRA
jgi:hypothetical protein